VIRVGLCETACADCFRRLGRTLRAVATDYGNGCPGCGVLAVGRGGTILYGDPLDPESEWTGITCAVPPSPLDEEPVIAGVAASYDTYNAVGAGGAVFFFGPAAGRGGCQRRDVGQTVTGGVRVESLAGAPGVFLSDVWAIDARRAFVVGDAGTLLQIEPDRVTAIKTGTQENLHAIWRNFDPDSGNPVLWVVGAGGALLRAEFR